MMTGDNLLKILPLIVACHDLGKFARGFQSLREDIASRLRPGFSSAAYSTRHDAAGYVLWRETILRRMVEGGRIAVLTAEESLADARDFDDFLTPWIRASSGHHGQPPLSRDSVNQIFSPEDVLAACDLVDAFLELFGEPQFRSGASGPLETMLAPSAWIVAGLVVLCDWVGSNTTWFPYEPSVCDLRGYYERARGKARKALGDTGLLPVEVASSLRFGNLFSFAPSPLQQFVDTQTLAAQSVPELFVVEDVTGAGKTEAAVTLAARLMEAGKGDGIYFALPTMATSDQMYERLATVYGRLFAPQADASLIRTHSGTRLQKAIITGSTDTNETAEVHCSAWLSDGRKRALLVNVGIGTIDQALLAVLPSRHNVLRLLGLHRKILIVDEVHSYDPYVQKLLEALLEFHARLGGSAILLTATLAIRSREALCYAFARGTRTKLETYSSSHDFPLVTRFIGGDVTSTGVEAAERSRRRVEVDWVHDERAARSAVIRAARNGKAVCWIRNSVDDAIDAAETIGSEAPDLAEGIDLFHAQFVYAHRLAIERRVLDRFGKEGRAGARHGRIVVATQVVEQSLDLDFDVMISDLAPIDLLIQRCGRLQRHPRTLHGERRDGADLRGTPHLIVLGPEFEDEPTSTWLTSSMRRTSYVYEDHAQLWRTMKILRERGGIETPGDSRLLIESVFADEAETPVGYERASERADGSRRAERSMASLNELKPDQGYRADGTSWLDDHTAITRLGEPTVTLRLVTIDDAGLVQPLLTAADCEAYGIDPRRIDRWSLGDISVRRSKISGSAEPLDPARITEAKLRMSDQAMWCEIFPMRRVNGKWEGLGWRNTPGQHRRVTYDATKGLKVEEV